jgi:endonuclease-3
VPRAVALEELRILERSYPAAVTALSYRTPYELLIAVILSAQSTDARVNLTTPKLFARFAGPADLAEADPAEVEELIHAVGFYRAKTRSIIRTAQLLVERHGGEVPNDREALEALPGVGRKTASVVLGVAFEEAAFAVDTHVFRVAHRLGLTLAKDPRGVEEDVTKLVPRNQWRHSHHWLILHGRQICKAPVPRCGLCPVAGICPSRAIVAKAGSAPARRGARGAAAPRRARSS